MNAAPIRATAAFAFALPLAVVIACGGSVVTPEDAGTSDGGMPGSDGSPSGCGPSYVPIPTATIYACDPVTDGGAGCPAMPSNGQIYPEGCTAYLPRAQGGCSGPCCGAQVCSCEPYVPLLDGGTSLGFVCPS